MKNESKYVNCKFVKLELLFYEGELDRIRTICREEGVGIESFIAVAARLQLEATERRYGEIAADRSRANADHQNEPAARRQEA